jgi:hypothetical protein
MAITAIVDAYFGDMSARDRARKIEYLTSDVCGLATHVLPDELRAFVRQYAPPLGHTLLTLTNPSSGEQL